MVRRSTDPVPFTVSRQGYDATGAATTHTDTLYVTKRVREPYPDQASLTALTASLSDYIYSTDTIDGATNGSEEISPTPIVNWATIDRRVVGNSLVVDLVAFHRDSRSGRTVAAITGTATDGTTTVTASTSTMIVLVHPQDRCPVLGYRLTFDITSLTDQAEITVNAKAYPFIGAAASVADSSTGTVDTRGFRPLKFLKHVAKSNNPPFVYVNATTGVDATVDANGVAGGLTKVSTTAATAAANPFATPVSAANALRAATAVTGGFSSGCVMRIQGTVAWGTNWTNATYQDGGCLYVEADPNDATAAITTGSLNVATRQTYLWYRNIAINRTGGTQSMGSGSAWTVLENVALNNDSKTGALFSTAWFMVGCPLSNLGGTVINNNTAECRMYRGLLATAAVSLEAWLVLGCEAQQGSTISQNATGGSSGGIVAFNRLLRNSTVNHGIQLAQAADVNGFAIVQSIPEFTGTVSTDTIGLGRDSGLGDITHLVCEYVTCPGAESFGRANILYDETTGTYRTHKLQRFRGVIWNQLNTKGDVQTTDGLHVGNWSFLYGVGCVGNMSMFIDAAAAGIGGPFAQAYPGLKANIGTSATVRNDPLFVDYKGTTLSGSTPVAGAGGGDYNLENGSPAIGVLALEEESLPLDLAGNARDRGSIGAYG